jgi:hypothetical protein
MSTPAGAGRSSGRGDGNASTRGTPSAHGRSRGSRGSAIGLRTSRGTPQASSDQGLNTNVDLHIQSPTINSNVSPPSSYLGIP